MSKIKKISLKAATSTILLLCSLEAHALSQCDSILQHGIYDYNSQLSDNQKHDVIKGTLCKSSDKKGGGGIGIELFGIFKANGKGSGGNISKYCNSDYSDLEHDIKFVNITKKVSQGIVKAWEVCMRNNNKNGQVSHYIKPTSDDKRIIYGTHFQPDHGGGPSQVKFTYWAISGANCPNNYRGKNINRNRLEMTCIRNPKSAVIVNAQSSDYGANLRSVELPGSIKPSIYYVNVYTGDHEHAGTDAGDFYITLVGSSGKQQFLLDNRDVDDRRRSAADSYTFNANKDLGDIRQIVIRSNARVKGTDGWLFKKAVVRNQSGNKTWNFPCHKNGLWIDGDQGHPLQRTASVNGKCW